MKTWGFLIFSLGCVIAISGAAKLHPQDSIMRTRGMLAGIAKRTATRALTPVVQKAQERLTAACLNKLSKSQLTALFETTYNDFLEHGVKTLNVRETVVTKAQLSAKVQSALLEIWKQKMPAPKKKKSPDATMTVLADVVRKMSSPPQKKKAAKGKAKSAKKAASRLPLQVPRAVKDVVSILRDKAVDRLVPYVLWKHINKQARHTVFALTLDMASGSVQALAQIGIAKHSVTDAMEGVARVAGELARSVAKKLGFKAKDYPLRLPPERHLAWTQRLAPALPALQSLQAAREIAHEIATIIARQYTPRLAVKLAKRMRMKWQTRLPSALPAARQAPAVRRAAPQPRGVVRAPATRPATQPAVGQKAPAARGKVAKVTPQPALQPEDRGLLVLGAKRERIGGWPDSLPVFLFGAGLALFGLFSWKRGLALEASASMAQETSDISNPFALLANLQVPLAALQQDIGKLNNQEVCDRVDEILSNYVLPFAEVRRGVIDRLGMEQGAEILVVVAYGERMLNRVWSAASDGHLPEALAVFPDALSAFTEAASLAKKADALPGTEPTEV